MIGRVSDIDLRLLRVFVAVVDAGGFSLATAKLNVAESTISQHMSDLERRLGLRLCERGRSGFRLTEAGEQVYKLTVDLLTGIEHYCDEVTSVRSDMAGTLKVGLPDAIFTWDGGRLGAALGRFLDSHPAMKLDIDMMTPRALERAVSDARIHLAIGPSHRRVATLRFLPLFTERNLLYAGRGHALFGTPDAAIDDAALNRANRIARGYLDRFDEQFFAEPMHRVTVHQVEAAATLVASGTCIGFLPDHFAAPFVQRGEMRAIRPERFSFASVFGAILRPEARQDPKVDAFVAAMQAELYEAGGESVGRAG